MAVASSHKGLTPGLERDVLQALRDGLPSKEIASRLHRSRATIEAYVRILRVKYNAHSRVQLVARAIGDGLLTLTGQLKDLPDRGSD